MAAFKPKMYEIGLSDGINVEILEGIEEGMKSRYGTKLQKKTMKMRDNDDNIINKDYETYIYNISEYIFYYKLYKSRKALGLTTVCGLCLEKINFNFTSSKHYSIQRSRYYCIKRKFFTIA